MQEHLKTLKSFQNQRFREKQKAEKELFELAMSKLGEMHTTLLEVMEFNADFFIDGGSIDDLVKNMKEKKSEILNEITEEEIKIFLKTLGHKITSDKQGGKKLESFSITSEKLKALE